MSLVGLEALLPLLEQLVSPHGGTVTIRPSAAPEDPRIADLLARVAVLEHRADTLEHALTLMVQARLGGQS